MDVRLLNLLFTISYRCNECVYIHKLIAVELYPLTGQQTFGYSISIKTNSSSTIQPLNIEPLVWTIFKYQ